MTADSQWALQPAVRGNSPADGQQRSRGYLSRFARACTENHSGADLFPWNREHWSSIDDTSQPYYPSADDIQADAAPHLSILDVPDNGALVDYVSAGEMIAMFRANFPGGDALAEPRVYAIGYHPPNFSETLFQRIDGALTEIDRHLAAAGTGPVVYARMSELTKAFPRP